MKNQGNLVGKQIRKHRIDNDLKLKDLAEFLNVSSAFVSKIEKGQARIPPIILNKICEFLKLIEREKNQLKQQILRDIISESREKYDYYGPLIF